MAKKQSKASPVPLTESEYNTVGLELERSIALTKVAMQRLDDKATDDLTLLALLCERLQMVESIIDAAGLRREAP